MSVDPKNIARVLKTLLVKNFDDKIKEVILFGSQVSGTAHENSDYDVLIVLGSGYDWDFWSKVMSLVYELELEYDILFNVFMISEDELQNSLRGAQPIFKNAIREGLYA